MFFYYSSDEPKSSAEVKNLRILTNLQIVIPLFVISGMIGLD